jgi:hypothetical protein
MASRLAKLLIALLLTGFVTGGGLLGSSSAWADGDPASDVLLGQNVFYPYDPPVSNAAAETLNSETAATKRADFQIKVALIAAPTDLGVIPSLFGKPQQYADFLYREITFLGPTHLLVVMYDGYGLQGFTPAVGHAIATLAPPRGKTSTELAQAAIGAVAKLAAAGRHPVQGVRGVPAGSSAGSGGSSSAPILIGLVVAAVAVATVVLVLRRRQAIRAAR